MLKLEELTTRMESTITAFNKDLSGLRTGRASANLLDGIMVDAYENMTPLAQVGSIGVPESRLLTVQVWDKSLVGAVEKAIMNANLGLNPSSDGQLVRIPMPDLTEERRKEMVKIGGGYAEKARISIRNTRRDGNDSAKKSEKDGDISKDEMHDFSAEVQKITDDFIAKIDSLYAAKEKDIMTI